MDGLPRAPPGTSVESTIHRDREGRWFHDGVRVEHDGVRRSFDAWIDRHANGRYVLKNAVNWAFVEIEGAPIIVKRVVLRNETWQLTLSDGRTEHLREQTLRQDADGVLYCTVRDGRLTAQFSRQAMFDLEPFVDEDEQGTGLRFGDRLVRPPVTDKPID